MGYTFSPILLAFNRQGENSRNPEFDPQPHGGDGKDNFRVSPQHNGGNGGNNFSVGTPHILQLV